MLLVFNWKSNPKTRIEAQKLAQTVLESEAKLPQTEARLRIQCVIAPSFAHLDVVAHMLKGTSVLLGVQDIGLPSLTGEVSGDMLRDLGVTYVIIGHSERRYVLGESDAFINEKMRAALRAGIIPIVCVGEREKVDAKRAIQESLNQLSLAIEGIVSENFVVAYEPVWAIGGDKEVDPTYVSEVIAGIQKYRGAPTLYGGSVNCENISSLVQSGGKDGFLVGSAGLRKESVVCLIDTINNIQ
ncbi:hypothetical protein A2755_00730 [Candidatus Wolfebacteria bacterium RIFCSPHIGHO2_01_FULL_48_22]|uniref:Triosephosphate isomerase n=2 Tax=Candidatus Wolfeibacteriota TaxID=1752735 RepID=A0A1F8DVS7_9BACT|nr:MAG: hypothetical protein A2755_00730 [Candidatus Wolfebacteria bacterium RIFCSPHIGHO2_01_FULL_48_22]OGM93540.1 MAG: hypothetical protein A2935_02840 [Candidatus Wolfebacteria bacterium RIFCSPLOWO2_01_FULL_47_17b]